jgi:hypothetical protein
MRGVVPKKPTKPLPPPDPPPLPPACPPPPEWVNIFALVAHEWAATPPKDAADRHAWALIWAGLKHFGAPVDIAGDVGAAEYKDAYRALLGGEKNRKSLATRRYVDAVLDGAKAVPAGNFAGFGELARVMCEHFGRPATDGPELKAMLENVIEAHGRPPAGKHTRGKIVQWLTGEEWELRRRGKKHRR